MIIVANCVHICHIIFAILNIVCLLFSVHGACDLSTEYQCYNDVCINKALEDNGVNDCGDNSDEGTN